MDSIIILSNIVLWLVVLFNLLLTLALIRRQQAPATKRKLLPVGEDAPFFEAETPDGQTITLEDFAQEDEIALVFVAPNCPACLQKIPFFNKLYPLARYAGVELVLVSDSDQATTLSFIAKHDITVPVLAAPRSANPFMETYKITGTPIYCLLDRFALTDNLLDGVATAMDRSRWLATAADVVLSKLLPHNAAQAGCIPCHCDDCFEHWGLWCWVEGVGCVDHHPDSPCPPGTPC